MKNTEKRGLFGKSLHLHIDRFQNPHPFTCFKRDRAKGVPKRSLHCKFIKKTKKPADILMTIALQRRRSRNPEEQFTPPATSLARLRQKRKRAVLDSSLVPSRLRYTTRLRLQNRRIIPTSTACTIGCFTFKTLLPATPPTLKLLFNSNAPGIQRKR